MALVSSVKDPTGPYWPGRNPTGDTGGEVRRLKID